jgi:hypothetical protein
MDLLNEHNGHWKATENDVLKYAIKKEFKSSNITGTGQKIKAILPFSNGEYYEEYLVNSDYLDTAFNKHNMKPELNCSFSNLLDKFKNAKPDIHNTLSTGDKKMLSLYYYYSYCKIKK